MRSCRRIRLASLESRQLSQTTQITHIRELAQLQGFNWHDANPSGAASIQWFNEWCKDGDPNTLQRILDYNEDDCIAMRVLKNTLEPFANK